MTKSNTNTPAARTSELRNIELAQISQSDANPRFTLDKEAFKELKKSIKNNGLLQPIAVRVVGDTYEIVGGHRRFLAVRELAREHPDDGRFKALPALVVDITDTRVAAARLAENINRADLNPLEIAEGIADAIKNGMTNDEVAESLGWAKRNVYRYRQFDAAPGWFKALATEVPMPTKKLDEHGAPVHDAVTDAPVLDVEMLPGLPFTHLSELLMLYGVLHENDKLELQEKGGEKFKPHAERIIKKLARSAAKDQWSIAKLRAEIKCTKDPKPRAATQNAPYTITPEKVAIDFKRVRENERGDVAAQLTKALLEFGYETVLIIDRQA